MPRKDAGSGPISAQAQQDLVSDGIENFELPKSLVTKIAKSGIPENSKLQKETVLSLVKGSTVFINYLAATAHDVALSKQHKSISASDVLKALELIEFGDLVDQLQKELTIYRTHAKTDKTKPRTSISSVAPPVVGTSASAPAGGKPRVPKTKAKGKEKETGTPAALPPPFTSAPLNNHGFGQSVSAVGSRGAMEVDWEEELGEAADAQGASGDVDRDLEGAVDEADADVEGREAYDEEDMVEGEGDDDVVDDDEGDGDDDEEGEGEELEDPMEVEEEELKKDARGLEDRGGDVMPQDIMEG